MESDQIVNSLLLYITYNCINQSIILFLALHKYSLLLRKTLFLIFSFILPLPSIY